MQHPSRVVLKLSGEVLAGTRKDGIDPKTLASVGDSLARALADGARTAVVLGGGNIFRGLGAASKGMDRVTADQMGMLATVMNGLALRDAIIRAGGRATLFTAFSMDRIGTLYKVERAREQIETGAAAIIAGGTGNPYFSTDTAAALRAVELCCQVFFKGTKVDGVFDKDPAEHKDAKRFTTLGIDELINRRLGVLDLTAATLCRENSIDIRVYKMTAPNAIYAAAMGEPIGTLVRATGDGKSDY
ncbi:MAG: UMP kinase [Myxococcota bacterium]|nr:UMP kinase [Myxococcota bacterium]